MHLNDRLPTNILHTLTTEGYTIELLAEDSPFTIDISASRLPSQRDEISLHLHADTPARPPLTYLRWRIPMTDIHLQWHPACGASRQIHANWGIHGVHSKSSRNAPVFSLYSMTGQNRLTFAWMEALQATFLGAGVVEETAEIECCAVLFTEPMPPLTDYHTSLILDDRDLPFSQVLDGIADLWEVKGGYQPAAVPETARLPMYSTWYSYHQQLDPAALEAECALAKPLGMDAIIVDDGWQTDDNARGYAFCGDWQVTPGKFPDFKAHVARVHDLGMQFILWFSVPFVGRHSQAYERFKDMLLDPDHDQPAWHVLDPRFPEVRTYLIDLYRSFITDYGIDGFKLDFIDTFQFAPETESSLGGGRDIDSLAEAVDRLLMDALTALKALKPEVMIEFRQAYIGPVMRKYGNMLRVGDVPNDFHGNRIGMVDVRLLAGSTAVHSDMLMWNLSDRVESAAMQLVHVLFSVPQISVRLAELPPAHRNMLRFYLDFWRENRDVLLDGEFLPEDPGALYPVVQARTREKGVAACYSGRLVDIRGRVPDIQYIINGTMNEELLINFEEEPGACLLTIWDCEGEELQSLQVDFYDEPYMIAIPPAGILQLKALPPDEG